MASRLLFQGPAVRDMPPEWPRIISSRLLALFFVPLPENEATTITTTTTTTKRQQQQYVSFFLPFLLLFPVLFLCLFCFLSFSFSSLFLNLVSFLFLFRFVFLFLFLVLFLCFCLFLFFPVSFYFSFSFRQRQQQPCTTSAPSSLRAFGPAGPLVGVSPLNHSILGPSYTEDLLDLPFGPRIWTFSRRSKNNVVILCTINCTMCRIEVGDEGVDNEKHIYI